MVTPAAGNCIDLWRSADRSGEKMAVTVNYDDTATFGIFVQQASEPIAVSFTELRPA
jgi:hypothetical protein